MTTIGERLRQLRGDRSQEVFAKELGISSQQTYANYERGRMPKLPVLQQIAQQTGVTVAWLQEGKPPMYAGLRMMAHPSTYTAGERDEALEVLRDASSGREQTYDTMTDADIVSFIHSTARNGVEDPKFAALLMDTILEASSMLRARLVRAKYPAGEE